MNFLTVKDASAKWEISARRVTALCEQGRIEGAVKAAGVWILPQDAKKPQDARIRSGNYVNQRKNSDMTSVDFEDNMKNLLGTFSVEGISLSPETQANLSRLASSSATYSQIIEELKKKYTRRS